MIHLRIGSHRWQGIFGSTRFVGIGHPRIESFLFSESLFDGSINQGARLLGFNGVFRDSFRRFTGPFPNEIRPNDTIIKRYTNLYITIQYDIMVLLVFASVFTHFGLCVVMSGDVGASNNAGSSSALAVTDARDLRADFLGLLPWFPSFCSLFRRCFVSFAFTSL